MLSPEIFRAAEINLGLLTRRQLIVTFGLSPHTVDALVRQGVLIPEHRGVYRLAGTPPSPRQAALAAVLRVPGPARVSGALVLGMLHADGFTEQDPFVLLRGEDVRLVNVKVPHRLDVAPDRDRAAFGPLPATTPLRALIEAADPRLGLPDGRLYAALDDLRFRGKIAGDDLHTRVEEWPPNAVGNRWRRLLDSPDAVSESHGERRLGDVLDTITPRAERQVWVTPKRRVDYLVRVLALILEYDGRKAHATKAGRRKDAHRDDDLETQGHRVVHVTAEDLAAPIALRARLVATYRQRARELGLHDLHIA